MTGLLTTLIEEALEELSFSDSEYTAFEKWTYKPIIHEEPADKAWIDFGQSFYRASLALVNGRPAEGIFYEDLEGVASIFLFRHYLELALKRIIVRGRCLIQTEKNAAWEDVKQVTNIHGLPAL